MKRLIYIGLIFTAFGFHSCQNEILFNPFAHPSTIQTVKVPEHFTWSLANRIDLTVDFEAVGDELESIEGDIAYLLDTTMVVMSRAMIHNHQAHFYDKVRASLGQMLIYLPKTGNYESIYSWSTLGKLTMPIAWENPDEDFGLNYLDNASIKLKNTRKSSTKGLKSAVFGNADFSSSELGEISRYSGHHETDGQWYRTTANKVDISIESYGGEMALKMGQGNKNSEVTQSAEFSGEGDLTVTMEVMSPGHDNIKIKIYLYFYDSDWDYLGQENSNNNLKKVSSWTEIDVSDEVPEGTAYVQLVIQDRSNRNTFYVDNVSTNQDSDPDTDGDGINNDEDEYPEDATKAFNNYFPGLNDLGTLSFEDLWPSKGDYDFNDLILDYQINQISNAANLVTSLKCTVILRAIGGSFHNGFGFSLPVNYNQIESVSGLDLQEGIVTVRGNGTEDNQSKAVIIVFEDAWNYLRDPGNSFVNTRLDANYVDPATFTFTINLTSPISAESIGLPPYNPFIFINGTRGRELHLHGQAPTDLVDASLFGTAEDFSNPDEGLYYQTADNLPWGIEFPSSFEYPIEKTPVDSAYTNFIEWAESGGLLKTEWYSDKKDYRRLDKIYHR